MYENGVQKHALSCFRAAGEKRGLPGWKKGFCRKTIDIKLLKKVRVLWPHGLVSPTFLDLVPVLLIICRDCEVQRVRYGEEVKDAPAGFP